MIQIFINFMIRIFGLTLPNPVMRRLGNLRLGAVDITTHKWFQQICFKNLYDRSHQSPYVPTVSSAGDSSNFDEYEEEDIKKSEKMKFGKEFAEF